LFSNRDSTHWSFRIKEARDFFEASHRQNHSIRQDFNQLLVHEAHIPGSKKTNTPGMITLDC
jgi:hypothetical protein